MILIITPMEALPMEMSRMRMRAVSWFVVLLLAVSSVGYAGFFDWLGNLFEVWDMNEYYYGIEVSRWNIDQNKIIAFLNFEINNNTVSGTNVNGYVQIPKPKYAVIKSASFTKLRDMDYPVGCYIHYPKAKDVNSEQWDKDYFDVSINCYGSTNIKPEDYYGRYIDLAKIEFEYEIDLSGESEEAKYAQYFQSLLGDYSEHTVVLSDPGSQRILWHPKAENDGDKITIYLTPTISSRYPFYMYIGATMIRKATIKSRSILLSPEFEAQIDKCYLYPYSPAPFEGENTKPLPTWGAMIYCKPKPDAEFGDYENGITLILDYEVDPSLPFSLCDPMFAGETRCDPNNPRAVQQQYRDVFCRWSWRTKHMCPQSNSNLVKDSKCEGNSVYVLVGDSVCMPPSDPNYNRYLYDWCSAPNERWVKSQDCGDDAVCVDDPAAHCVPLPKVTVIEDDGQGCVIEKDTRDPKIRYYCYENGNYIGMAYHRERISCDNGKCVIIYYQPPSDNHQPADDGSTSDTTGDEGAQDEEQGNVTDTPPSGSEGDTQEQEPPEFQPPSQDDNIIITRETLKYILFGAGVVAILGLVAR